MGRAFSCCVLALGILLGASVPGQAATFDAAYARMTAAAATATATSAEELLRAATAASDVFLHFASGTAERASRLAQGLEATVLAGRLDIAIDLAPAMVAAAPTDSALAMWQLRALARAGRLEGFTAEAASARERGLDSAVAMALAFEEWQLVPLADRALRHGDTELGRDIFRSLALLDPPQAFRFANLGLCLRNLGDIAGAVRAYDRARELAPDDAQIENDRGLMLRARGRVDEALLVFRQSYASDAAAGGQLGSGPAITNLLHFEALAPGGRSVAGAAQDPLPLAGRALAVRPTAAMLRRLVLDVTLDRLAKPAPAQSAPGSSPGSTPRDR